MSTLEKQQVVSFLKILQIPTDLSPEQIKHSLLEAGWNEKDADEAISVLQPHGDSVQTHMSHTDELSTEDQHGTVDTPVPQIVAQKYAPNRPVVAPPSRPVEAPPSKPIDDAGSMPEKSPEEQIQPQVIAQKYVQQQSPEATPSQTEPVVATSVPPAPHTEQLRQDEAEVARVAETITREQEAKSQTIDNTVDRPHEDAPWLEHQVDIYDVTPEEREEMIRTVYRTNEKLSPQTIHALLGIDVDLSEFEHDFSARRSAQSFTWWQISIIIIMSLIIAAFGFVFGMYVFEVGPFHPTLNNY